MNTNSGESFLNVHQGQSFIVAPRALEKLAAHTGFPATRAVAMAMFRRAHRVRSCELWPMGSWRSGSNEGKRTRWYFRFRVFSQELIAVVSEGEDEKTLEWTATYHLAAGDHEETVQPMVATAVSA